MSEETGVPESEKRRVRAVLRSSEARVRSQWWKARLMTTRLFWLPALLQIRRKKSREKKKFEIKHVVDVLVIF